MPGYYGMNSPADWASFKQGQQGDNFQNLINLFVTLMKQKQGQENWGKEFGLQEQAQQETTGLNRRKQGLAERMAPSEMGQNEALTGYYKKLSQPTPEKPEKVPEWLQKAMFIAQGKGIPIEQAVAMVEKVMTPEEKLKYDKELIEFGKKMDLQYAKPDKPPTPSSYREKEKDLRELLKLNSITMEQYLQGIAGIKQEAQDETASWFSGEGATPRPAPGTTLAPAPPPTPIKTGADNTRADIPKTAPQEVREFMILNPTVSFAVAMDIYQKAVNRSKKK